jgi:hypothetical protein
MNRTFSTAQATTIEDLRVMRAARMGAIAAEHAIGPIAVHHALAPLRDLIDAASELNYAASHALATALGSSDIRHCTVGELLALIARIPA